MGVKILIEKTTFDSSFESVKTFSSGLLIGQVSNDAVHVFLPVATPPKPSADNDVLGSAEDLSHVSDRWVANHARNLTRMLPGGLAVVGIYVCDQQIHFSKDQNHLKKILTSLRSKGTSHESDFLTKLPSEKVALFIDVSTNKIVGKVLDASDKNASIQAATTKVKPILDGFSTVRVNLAVSFSSLLPTERKKDKIREELESGVQPFLQRIVFSCQLLVNMELRDLDDLVFKKPTSKGGDHDSKNKQSSDITVPDLTLFGAEFPILKNLVPDENCNDVDNESLSQNQMQITGKIPGLAFLSHKVTVGDTLKYLREDIVRSIYTRLELLTEEMQITGGEVHVPRMLLPQRVLVSLPVCAALPLSDYKFFSETPEDVLTRVKYFCSPVGHCFSEESRDNGGDDDDDEDKQQLVKKETAPIINSHEITESSLNFEFEKADKAESYTESEELCNAEVIDDLEQVTKSVSEGHGRSEGPRGKIDSLDKFISDVMQLTKSIKERFPNQKYVVFGHSMGGLITTKMCLDFPEAYHGIILEGAAFEQTSLVLSLPLKLLAPIAPNMPVRFLSLSDLSTNPKAIETVQQDPLYSNQGIKAITALSVLNAVINVRSRITQLKHPIFVTHGQMDRICPTEGSVYIHDHCSSSDKSLLLVPNALHQVHNEVDHIKKKYFNDVTTWVTQRFI